MPPMSAAFSMAPSVNHFLAPRHLPSGIRDAVIEVQEQLQPRNPAATHAHAPRQPVMKFECPVCTSAVRTVLTNPTAGCAPLPNRSTQQARKPPSPATPSNTKQQQASKRRLLLLPSRIQEQGTPPPPLLVVLPPLTQRTVVSLIVLCFLFAQKKEEAVLRQKLQQQQTTTIHCPALPCLLA